MTTVLVAPDSFKGTHTAAEVAAAIAAGLRAGGCEADVCPLADGGDGTLEVIAGAIGATRHAAQVSDPLGRPIRAGFALKDDVAIVETAAASGLVLVDPADRDPVGASTRGTGELIAAALRAGARTVYIGVGGSATTDGGAGAVAALKQAGGPSGARLIVLCDVQTPFEDAARVFGPQKGAAADAVALLSARLQVQADAMPRDPRGVPMTGAAGGLSGGLWAAFDASLAPGADFILDLVGFDERMRRADAVVTGEGRLDSQTLAGKVVGAVAQRAGRAGVPCYAIVGSVAATSEDLAELGIAGVIDASDRVDLEAAGRRLGEQLQH